MSWERLVGTPLHIDAFDLLAQLPDGCVDLVFCDPPYNIGIFAKMPPDEYLEWCGRWIAEASRVLAANGAFWVVHSKPLVLGRLSEIVAQYGRRLVTWATWDKYNGAPDTPFGIKDTMNCTKLHPQGKRSFDQDAEYLIYHADEGEWVNDWSRYSMIWDILNDARNGQDVKTLADKSGYPMSTIAHFFQRTASGWRMPSQKHIDAMGLDVDIDALIRMRDKQQQKHKHLRYTFNNPGKVSSVWQIPPAPKNGHPTPKPVPLLERIIKATSNEGDAVLDFFAGSFTTAVVAERLGRRWICGDYGAEWVELGRKRLAEAQQLELELA